VSQATIARDRAGSGFFQPSRDVSRENRDGGGVRFLLNAISMTIPPLPWADNQAEDTSDGRANLGNAFSDQITVDRERSEKCSDS
jgi:hypothetical protein